MEPATPHPSFQDLLDYVSGAGTEELYFQVDIHLADCPDCLAGLLGLVYLRDHFETVWESWTPAEHGRVREQFVLAESLQRAAESSPAAARVVRWLFELSSGAGVAVKLLLSRAKHVASAAASLVPPGHDFELRPAFAGVGAPEQMAQLEAHLRQGSEFLAQDFSEKAMTELLEAVRIDARSPQTAVSTINRDGWPFLQVVVDGFRGSVWVKCLAAAGQGAPALAVLLPDGDARGARFAEFQAIQGEPGLLAEFEDVSDGVYRLVVGPIRA